jgi:two-component system, OmpR family, phosphate regulon response regulator PhoB
VLYRFPDLQQFEQMVQGTPDNELELGLPSGESVDDGEWVLAIFELGAERRATSAAARASVAPDGARLMFEPRDWQRLAEFVETAGQPARRSQANLEPSPPAAAVAVATIRSPGVSAHTSGVARPASPPFAGPHAAQGARVLIVDDDPDIRQVVAAMLHAVGLTVIPAASAEDALTRVRAEPFDLLVLDWNLPKMTGIDLCRLIRREPGLMKVPVLFLTANASSQDMVDAFACGADDYVVKPFRAPELGARIFSLLRRARMASAPD